MRFSLEVSHCQIAVFDPAITDPFNDWSKEHVRQGFAWRPGSVSFTTLDGGGEVLVLVESGAESHVEAATAERLISVPFHVPDHGRVEVATIIGSEVLELPPGHHELIFAHGRSIDGIMWVSFFFRPVAAPVAARVVRGDPRHLPDTALVMTARPA